MTFAFVVLRLSGDPALLIMSVDAPPEAIKAFREAWGLERPIWDQYLSCIAHAFTGDFGKSMRDGRPAIDLVMERVPATLAITLPALALKVGLGIPAGIYAALHRNSFADRLTMAVSVAGFTMPSFVLALLLVLVFAVNLGWLPASGADSPDLRHPAHHHPGRRGGRHHGALHPLGHARSAGPALYPRRLRQGRRMAARHLPPCPAQRRHPDRHHHRLHDRQPGGGRGRGRACSPGPASAGCWCRPSPTATSPWCRRS